MAEARDEWNETAKRFLKVELKRADVGYAELARRMTEMGLVETEGSVTVKINRGAYPAWFLFAALRAIGVLTLRLDGWETASGLEDTPANTRSRIA